METVTGSRRSPCLEVSTSDRGACLVLVVRTCSVPGTGVSTGGAEEAEFQPRFSKTSWSAEEDKHVTSIGLVLEQASWRVVKKPGCPGLNLSSAT